VAATWRDLRTKNILSEEWYDFERYVTDISASPKFARFAARTDTPLYLDRIDYEKPFGPENFLFSSIRKQRIKRSHGKIDLETYTQIFGAMTRLDRMKALREAKEKGYTLLQLGRLLNVTRERVRQIIRSQPTPRMLKEAAWRPSNRQRAVFNLWQAGLDTRDISTKINIPFRAVARIRAGLKKRNVPLRKRNEDHARNFARLVSQTAPPGPSPVCDPSVETPVGGGSD
jgi:hypothetical protein